MTGRRLHRLVWTTLLLGAAGGAVAAPAASRFSFQGLTPAVAGLDRAKAEAALGQPLQLEPLPAGRAASAPAAAASGAAGCQHRQAPQQPGVRYTLAGDVITRAETRDARYPTISGVRVGDSLAQAQKVYGKRLSTGAHPYFAQGKVLTVYSPDRKFALVMETNDQGRIITLRGGRLPDVGWLEGCS